MTDTGRTEDFATLLETVAESVFAEIHTCMPGRVVSYDDATGRAVVELDIKERIAGDGDEDDTYDAFSTLVEVPVMAWKRGDWIIHSSVTKKEPVMVHFAERSLDEWLETFERGIEPVDPRRFDLNDAIAVPGLLTAKHPISASVREAGSLTIAKIDGSVRIRLKENGGIEMIPGTGQVCVGEGVLGALSLATPSDAKINEIITQLNLVITAVNVLTGGGGIAPVTPYGGSAASKIKAV